MCSFCFRLNEKENGERERERGREEGQFVIKQRNADKDKIK